MSSIDAVTLGPSLKEAVNTFERTLIHSVLVACDWNQRKTAEALGVLPTTLSEKIFRLKIGPPSRRLKRPRDPEHLSVRSETRPERSLPAIEIAAQVNGWCESCRSSARPSRAANR